MSQYTIKLYWLIFIYDLIEKEKRRNKVRLFKVNKSRLMQDLSI
jgi:CRISPR/Cas system-associated endoribonuclease Cas2